MESTNGARGPLGRGVPFVLTLAFLLSACGGGGGGGGDSATGSGTASSGRAGSVQLEDLNQDGKIVLLAFGDSITAGVGDGADATALPAPPAGYPPRLQNLLGLPVINDGIPGEKTPTGLRRLGQDLGRFSPDFVIILEGTNDLENGDADGALQNIQSMIDSVFASGGQPLLGTITPSCCAHQNQLPEPAILFYNDRLREMATSNSVPLIDFYAAFAGGPEASYPVDGIPVDGTPMLIHVSEGLHPTPAGYDLMAETARGIFKLPKPGSIPAPTPSAPAG